MNPKKPKEFIKPTADALSISETLVDDVIGFYWSAVRKALSELEGPSIAVANLGIFKARYKKIEKIESKYQTYLDNLESDKMTFNKHAIQKVAKAKLEGLSNLREEMESEYKRKELVKTKRKEYVNNKDMEEQREDIRGAEEQSI